MPAAVRKPLVVIAGKPQQLPVGETLDTPERSVSVVRASGGALKVTIGASGPALVFLADGSSREVGTGSAGVWRIGLNPAAAADPVDISGKLDADFNSLTASAGQDADLLPLRRAASNFKLTLANLVTYITGVARSWAGKQTFSAGADISTLGVTGESTLSGGAKLGELAPLLKCKVLTGTMPSSAGAANIVAHGLTQGNIVFVRAAVSSSDGYLVFDGNGYATASFECAASSTHLRVTTVSSSSADVLGRPLKFFVFYQ